MFGKLLKYDLRSMWKQFAFVWPAALVLALLHRFSLPSIPGSVLEDLGVGPGVYLSDTTSNIIAMVYAAVLVAMLVLVVIFIIQRFYKGLLGDEGYLMHTLPVKPWQLIGSKLSCALVVMFVSLIVAVASMVLMVPLSGQELQALWDEFIAMQAEQGVSFLLMTLEFVLAAFIAMARSFLQLYLAMAVGHLFSKNRVAASVVAYVAINAITTTLADLIGTGTAVTLTTVALQTSASVQTPDPGLHHYVGAFENLLLISLLVELILAAVFFIATNYILKNKLNLE